jgi:hypothetical protein
VLAYKHDVSAEDQIEILKKAKGRIIRIKAEYKKPFIAKIDATGEIRMMLGQKAKKKVV